MPTCTKNKWAMHTSERSTTLDEFDESSLSPKRNCGTREFLLALSLLAHFWLARNPDLSLPSETSMCLAPTERDLKNLDNYMLGKTGAIIYIPINSSFAGQLPPCCAFCFPEADSRGGSRGARAVAARAQGVPRKCREINVPRGASRHRNDS